MRKRQYDPALRKTAHGAKLYNAWKKLRRDTHAEEWDFFPTFYNWAMQNGYVNGSFLRLVDETGAYEPNNCTWRSPGNDADYPPSTLSWEHKWNETVNRIRKHYGMPPLEGTKYGN